MTLINYPWMFARPRFGSRGEPLVTNRTPWGREQTHSYPASFAHAFSRSMPQMGGFVCGLATARSGVRNLLKSLASAIHRRGRGGGHSKRTSYSLRPSGHA